MIMKNNILSYFNKDIKDPIELAFYKQKNIDNTIEIFYKNELLYILNYDIIMNLKTNIIKNIFFSSIGNYKCESCIKDKYKFLYYKNDKLVGIDNFNFIYYDFSYTKYFSKQHYEYVISEKANSKANKKANSIEEKLCAYTIIKYYKCFKYIYTKTNSFKYKYVQIFIMNKYELHYFNKFFNLFFVVLCFSSLLFFCFLVFFVVLYFLLYLFIIFIIFLIDY